MSTATQLQAQGRPAIHVTIGAQVRIPMDGLSWDLLSRLKVPFTRSNPLFQKARRSGRYAKGIEKNVQGWAEEEGWGGPELVLPRGQAGGVIHVLRKAGLIVEVERDVCEGEPLTCTFQGELRPYQEPAVQSLVEGVQGLCVAPCGAGKTVIGMAAAARVGRSTLILVHTHDLATQWAERIRQSLGVEAGMIGGGRNDVRPITIAMLQTMARMGEPEVIALGRRFGVLIVDECHHIPALTCSRAVNALACRLRWGLSATPVREDGLHFVLEWVLGPCLHRIDQASLIAAGHLMPARITQVPYYRKLDWLDLSARYQAARQTEYERMKAKAEQLERELRELDTEGEGEGDNCCNGKGEGEAGGTARSETNDSGQLPESAARGWEGEGAEDEGEGEGEGEGSIRCPTCDGPAPGGECPTCSKGEGEGEPDGVLPEGEGEARRKTCRRWAKHLGRHALHLSGSLHHPRHMDKARSSRAPEKV